MKKALVIRFSAFGDIFHCLYCLGPLKQKYPEVKIDFLTREEFRSLVSSDPLVEQVIAFDRKNGLTGLWNLAGNMVSGENSYDLIYDAHNSLRSKFLKLFCFLRNPFHQRYWITRPKNRWKRILLFTFRVNKFPRPFRAMLSFLEPLKKLGIEETRSAQRALSFPVIENELAQSLIKENSDWLLLAPSAAWEMKRWPIGHWKELIQKIPEKKIVLIGGPADTFCEEIRAVDPSRVINLAGKLSLVESCSLIQLSSLLVSADTGAIHVADILGKKAISLIGPSAFGFATSEKIQTLDVDLPCRPCSKDGRGTCSQEVYQKCMVDISVDRVALSVQALLSNNI